MKCAIVKHDLKRTTCKCIQIIILPFSKELSLVFTFELVQEHGMLIDRHELYAVCPSSKSNFPSVILFDKNIND